MCCVCQFYEREHKPAVSLDAIAQVSASIQDVSTLSCQAMSTPLTNSSDDNSTGSTGVQRRRCRVRHVDIQDASEDDRLDDSSICLACVHAVGSDPPF